MAHPDFTKAVDQAIDLNKAVRAYRENETSLRQLRHNGNRSTATIRAIGRREREREALQFALLLGGFEKLVGELKEEADLNERVFAARRARISRPDLVRRAVARRRAITTWLEAQP
jgi:hypothetical protein